jgi:hypothetical protein
VVEVTTEDLGGGDRREVGRRCGIDPATVSGDQGAPFEDDVGGVPVEEDSTKFHVAPMVVCI